MTRLLFVDDDTNILQGLQRMLRPMRGEWEMSFAESATEAIERIAVEECDVIISDMRMPGMNGAQLLEVVRARHPGIVRVALSGHTDRELILQAVGATHQFLAKPCDAAVLKDTITRVSALSGLVADQAVRESICWAQCIPSPEPVYNLLVEEVRSETGSVARIGQIVSSDIGMSVKTLHLVNSAFFGLTRVVCDPAKAVAMLGIDTMRELIETGAVFYSVCEEGIDTRDLDIWTVSALTARICGDIAAAESLPQVTIDAARTSGLLHRVGALITPQGRPFADAGADEATAGAYLLSLWGFAPDVIEAVGWYRNPSQSPLGREKTAAIVHVGNILAHEFAGDDNAGSYEIDRAYLAAAGFGDRLAQWRRLAANAVMDGVYK